MRMNHAARRALRLLDRGVDVAYVGLTEHVRQRIERAGYVADGVLTPIGRAAVFRSGDASVMLEESEGPPLTTGTDR